MIAEVKRHCLDSPFVEGYSPAACARNLGNQAAVPQQSLPFYSHSHRLLRKASNQKLPVQSDHNRTEPIVTKLSSNPHDTVS